MHAMMTPRRSGAGAGGFTLIEALVAVTILGVLLAMGIPSLSGWLLASKAASASELYVEGVRLARQQALGHNAQSRLVLSTNALNGQFDWQIDICFPTASAACDTDGGAWSSVTAASSADPEGASGYTSVTRSAAALPSSSVLAPTLVPADSVGVYFNARGWVDSNIASNLSKLTLTPTTAYAGTLRTSAVRVTLAGTAIPCDPTVVSTDSRACQP